MYKKSPSGLQPVLKWVGGKRQLLDAFDPLFPEKIDYYCEPFAGGAAVFLHLRPQKALISDINGEIINLYQVIRDDVDGLIAKVSQFTNTKECYYEVRDWDRREDYQSMSAVDKAARILYLNRVCFNGVYRVNKQGYFNVPFGNYKKPMILNTENLYALHQYFNEADITFKVADYQEVLKEIPNNAFVYLDPPYDPVSPTASFTSYAKDGFSREDQIQLRKCCDALWPRGVKFMLSNSATDFIKEQYDNYHITIVKANRSINRDGRGRGAVDEVVIRNYTTKVDEKVVEKIEPEEFVTPVHTPVVVDVPKVKVDTKRAVNTVLSEDVYQACVDLFAKSGMSMRAGIADIVTKYVQTGSLQNDASVNLVEAVQEAHASKYEEFLMDVQQVLDSAAKLHLYLSMDQAITIVLGLRN